MAISKMTKKEAIAQLKMNRDLCNFNPMTGEEEPMNEDCRKSAEALDMAIKALEQETCKDAVSRKAVLNTLDFTDKFLDETRTVESYKTLLEECYKNLPSVTPTRKKGKWIPPKNDDGMSDPIEYLVRCSVCGFDIDPQTYAIELKRFGANKYCPHCGAKMEVEENDSN